MIRLVFALMLFWALPAQAGWQTRDSNYDISISGGAAVPFQLDGSNSANNAVWPGTGQAISLTTAQSQGIIYVSILTNAASVTSVTAVALTFTERPNPVVDSFGSYVTDFTAPYSGGQCNSGCSITVSPATTNYTTVTVFGISGDKASSPFDPNASVPASSTTTTPLITTSNANDMVVTNIGTGANCTAGSGWTLINGTNLQCVEYQIFTSTQSGLTPTFSGAVAVGGKVDAVQKGP